MPICRFPLTAAALALSFASAAQADEGMWTFDAFPAAQMRKDYGWAPDTTWLDRTRAAAVRLTGGCSASFVSPQGLILTNHHCVVECAQDNSTDQKDYLKDGFVPARREEELKCPGQQAEVVTAISDVTGRVKAAIGALSGEALVKARNGVIAQIEQEGCTDAKTTQCEVVTLFGGGQYKLYTFRKYSDVRLAWAPQFQAAFFGGDPDNFNYPRYALDAAFLRAYENGKPVKVASFLKWNPRAPQVGEATFVVGNPGSTQRLFTSDQIAFQREVSLPITITTLSELRGRMISAMDESAQQKREGADGLFGIENSLKVYIGRQKALNDPDFIKSLADVEADIKAKTLGKQGVGDPWSDVGRAVKAYRDIYLPWRYITPSGTLMGYAKTLVQGAAEREKPDGERLPGFSQSNLALTEKTLLDAAPVYPWLEQIELAWSLSKAREYLGADDPDTKLMLGKEAPEALAERLVGGTTLADPVARKALWDGGSTAIAASTDPLIIYARGLDARERALKKLVDERYAGPLAAAGAKLADARFAAYGDKVYPDATFSLRISYGTVQGWTERGQQVEPVTTMGGAFDRATGAAPYDLASGFVASAVKIDKAAPFDFVTTNDIIGGNSGSPVIDRAGSVIGAAFDGNIHSIGGNYGYQADVNRTVVVSAAAIQQALEVIYPAPGLVKELKGK
ncbi:S46 family peptidase [Novosphingobium sp. MMS21-SN21R]|uniref:S46 family peptidase n=1 Tax=Novosphingobium sp. MMS21-SN21R TaxID=2969298 RepID=UPI0028868C68|nr:S46 family peptidase [Novosphingobium sp. MMS21-SN21R]MDT0508663.1 S46 family peptidase [Novosphingobium sp. MMS21-SN21R]